MDIEQLSTQLTQSLAPFLPYLLKAGEKAAQEAGKNMGKAAWEQAKALWAKLRPRVEAKPAALEAAQDVAADPDDEDTRATLRHQLKKLLAEDKALARELAETLGQAQAAGVNGIPSSDRYVAIAGDVSASTIITGDQE